MNPENQLEEEELEGEELEEEELPEEEEEEELEESEGKEGEEEHEEELPDKKTSHKAESETKEERQTRRAKERKDRRIAAREARIRDKLTISSQDRELRTQRALIAEIQNNQTQITEHLVNQNLTGIDKDIEMEKQNVIAAKNLLLNARNKADTANEIRADDMLYEARRKLENLQGQKAALVGELNANNKRADPRQADPNPREVAPKKTTASPVAQQLANSWMNKVKFASWPQNEKNLAVAEELQLKRENTYSVESDEFYKELTRRIGVTFPARAGLAPKKSVPKIGGNSSGGGGAKRTVESDMAKGIPQETITAWRKAGLWKDGDLKQKERMRANFKAEFEKGKK